MKNKIILSKKQKELWQTLVFLLKIIVFSIPLYIILYFVNLSPLQEIVAENAYFIFKTAGFYVWKNGFMLSVNDFPFFISEDCTGWKSMLFLTALIIAVPCVEWKKKLAGILIGIPILWIGNIARIFLIVLIGINYGFEAAELVHTYLWQLGLISLVLLIWLIWLYWVRKIFKTKSKSNLNG